LLETEKPQGIALFGVYARREKAGKPREERIELRSMDSRRRLSPHSYFIALLDWLGAAVDRECG